MACKVNCSIVKLSQLLYEIMVFASNQNKQTNKQTHLLQLDENPMHTDIHKYTLWVPTQ